MRIGALIQQKFRDFVVIVVQGDHQGGHTFRRGHIDVGAGADQRFDALVTAFARRVQQGGQTAVRVVLPTRFGRDLTRPVGESGAGVYVCAVFKKNIHHLGGVSTRGGSPNQRCLVLNLLDGVDVGARIDQHPNNAKVSAFDGEHQRGLAFRVGAFGARPRVQKHPDHLGVIQLDGLGERRGPEFVDDVNLGIPRDQPGHQLMIDPIDRPVNRPRSVGLRFIHVRSRLNHVERRKAVSSLNQAGQPPWPILGQIQGSGGNHKNNGENETLHSFLQQLDTVGVQLVMVSP